MEDDLENDARCPMIRSLSLELIPNNLCSLERSQAPTITHVKLYYRGSKTDSHTMDELILAYGTYYYGIIEQIL